MRSLKIILFLTLCLLMLSVGGAAAQQKAAQGDIKVAPTTIRGVKVEGKMIFHTAKPPTARDSERLCEGELWRGVRYPAEANGGVITHLSPVFYDIIEEEFFIFDKANGVCSVYSFLEYCPPTKPKYVYGGLRVIPFADLTVLAKCSNGSFVLNDGREEYADGTHFGLLYLHPTTHAELDEALLRAGKEFLPQNLYKLQQCNLSLRPSFTPAARLAPCPIGKIELAVVKKRKIRNR